MTRPLKTAEIRRALAQGNAAPSNSEIARVVESQHLAFGESAVAHLTRQISTEVLGSGPLQQFLDDPRVTDVLVNDVDDVWIDRGRGLQRVPVDVGGPVQLRALAVRLAAQCGTRLDDSSPSADGRLPDGTRLHALLHPVCESAAVISLRTSRSQTLSLNDLVRLGTIPPAWHDLLRRVVDARLNFLISGATGTGKTTLLSTLLSYVQPTERIVVVEESREIRPDHAHVVSLETKKPNIEGHGEVSQVELVRHTLRMRPDRVVVGECRGAEVRDMLSALNTGHDGGAGTIHANSARDVPARLEALGALAGMSREALTSQATSAFDLVIHVDRRVDELGEYRRRVAEISVLGVSSAGHLESIPAFSWTGQGGVQRLAGAQHLEEKLEARLERYRSNSFLVVPTQSVPTQSVPSQPNPSQPNSGQPKQGQPGTPPLVSQRRSRPLFGRQEQS